VHWLLTYLPIVKVALFLERMVVADSHAFLRPGNAINVTAQGGGSSGWSSGVSTRLKLESTLHLLVSVVSVLVRFLFSLSPSNAYATLIELVAIRLPIVFILGDIM